jgi:hypothetical protein
MSSISTQYGLVWRVWPSVSGGKESRLVVRRRQTRTGMSAGLMSSPCLLHPFSEPLSYLCCAVRGTHILCTSKQTLSFSRSREHLRVTDSADIRFLSFDFIERSHHLAYYTPVHVLLFKGQYSQPTMQYFFLTAAVAAFAQVAITQTIDPNSVPLSTRREHPTSTLA